MAYTGKNYLDLAGLTKYDGLIKKYIDDADALSIKFAKVSSDGNKLLLYKDKSADATSAEADADYEIPMGSEDLKNLIKNLGTAVGATYTASPEGFSVSFTGDIAGSASVVAAVQAVNNHIGALSDLDTTTKTTVVAAINELFQAIADLDVAEFALTETNNDVISIYGIKENEGKIAKGTSKIDLAKIAKTGAAVDASTTAIDDGEATPTILYPAGTVQGTLSAIANDLHDLESESAVTVEKLATAETGYLASYAVKQNGAQVGATINIPKDYLVKSASVQTVTVADQPYTGAVVGDKYIDFVINVKEGTATDSHIYIPVNDLVHPLSGGTTTVANMYELQVSVSATNQITATLNNIYGAKVLYTPASATTKLASVTEVAGALDAIDILIQDMDADKDAVATGSADTYGYSPLAVMTGVTEVDGKITSVDSGDADPFGTATAAYNAIGSIPEASITALFSTT